MTVADTKRLSRSKFQLFLCTAFTPIRRHGSWSLVGRRRSIHSESLFLIPLKDISFARL